MQINSLGLQNFPLSSKASSYSRTARPTQGPPSRATPQRLPQSVVQHHVHRSSLPPPRCTAYARDSRSTKSKRRAGLKKLSGKKGSVFEESYLLVSLKKSIEVRLVELQGPSSLPSRL